MPTAQFLVAPTRRRVPRAALSLLPIALALCLAAPPLRAGGPSSRSRHPLLALSAGGAVFANSELRHTYGTMPVVGLRVYAPVGRYAQLFAGLQYFWKNGAPLPDDPVFESDAHQKLAVLPLEIGLRTNLAPGRRTRVMFGCAAEYSWVREEMRGFQLWEHTVRQGDPGSSLGFRLLLGPEWEFGRGTWVAGSELAAGPRFSGLNSEDGLLRAEFTTLTVHAWIARRL